MPTLTRQLVWCTLLLLQGTACDSPPVEAPRTTVTQVSDVRVQQNIKNKVDVLFMIDNSYSMDAMQLELRQRFGDFFKVFEDLASQGTFADLHIGVVTSDYGAGDISNITSSGGCDASPGGQRGLLQTGPSPTVANPPVHCAPPMGNPFIAYAFDPAGSTAKTNLPNGTDATALLNEFTCMATVGSKGCGFEHQLESVYAALKNTDENAGFLRDDALLTVVFVTNEDDGSAAPMAKFYEPSATGEFGQYSTFRQTRFAVSCDGVAIPYAMGYGPLMNCAATPNPNGDTGLAYDISRYINFFSLPSAQGGVKADPKDVILVGIDAPTTSFETIVANPQTTGPYVECMSQVLTNDCQELLQHSCENTVKPEFFGDPAVRINAVINSVTNHNVTSICGDDSTMTPDFSKAMQQLGQLISSQIGPGCLSAPIANRTDGTADCTVEDVTPSGDPSKPPTIVEIKACSDTKNATPCWEVVDLLAQYQSEGCVPPPGPEPATCKLPLSCQPVKNPVDQTLQLGSVSINRGGQAPLPLTTARVSCETIASSHK